MPTDTTLYTIGHSNHAWPDFLARLRAYGIEVLADVRSNPYSRFPHFGRERMVRALEAEGVGYLWLGGVLGGKPEDPFLLGPDGRPDGQAIASTQGFREAIAMLAARSARGERVAVMCSEGDPARCHRTRLIAPALRAKGVLVRDILPREDGGVDREFEDPRQLPLFPEG